jgi:hypothetical protein
LALPYGSFEEENFASEENISRPKTFMTIFRVESLIEAISAGSDAGLGHTCRG